MSNLHFHYGVMGSSKSALLGINAFNFIHTGNKIEVLKPTTDNRDSQTKIVSRIGIETDARALPNLCAYVPKPDTQFILVDEVQFFAESDIDTLVRIADNSEVVILCYGLMVDSNEHIFPASRRLVEVGATLHRMESTCQIPGCTHMATHHLRFDDAGTVIRAGNQIAIGASQYKSVCRRHFNCLYYGSQVKTK